MIFFEYECEGHSKSTSTSQGIMNRLMTVDEAKVVLSASLNAAWDKAWTYQKKELNS